MRVSSAPSPSNVSGWFDVLSPSEEASPLHGDQHADVVVIGGGFSGLAAARRLAEHQPDSRIILLEAQRIGMGASGQNAGFILDIPQFLGGNDESDDAAYAKERAFNLTAIDHLRTLVRSHGIDCGWREQGKFNAAAEDANARGLEPFRARLERMGIPHEWHDGPALERRLGTPFYRAAVETKECVLIQPAALARGLARTLPANTVSVHENSPVKSIDYGARIRIACAQGTVTADNLFLATNAFTKGFGFLKSRIMPFFLTGSLTRPLGDAEYVALGNVEDWGIISAHPMGATVRLTHDRRILVRNTAEFRSNPVQVPGELRRYRAIHDEALRRRFPMLPDLEFEHTWGGFMCMTQNKTTMFGQLADNIHASIADNASGITRGTTYGRLLADRFVGATSDELSTAEAMSKPSWIPPRPFLDIGIHMTVAKMRRSLGQDL